MVGAALLVVLAWLTAPATSPQTPTTASDAEAIPSPAPAGPQTAAPEPVSLVDPWASVPVQTAAPRPPTSAPTIQTAMPPQPATRSAPRHDPPLLDPWSGVRRAMPPQVDPDLRDPFRGMRAHDGPHVARAELRNPFARRRAGQAAPRPEPTPSPAAAGMPLHPDLRDPFQRPSTARPTPPAPDATRPLAPPSSAPAVPAPAS